MLHSPRMPPSSDRSFVGLRKRATLAWMVRTEFVRMGVWVGRGDGRVRKGRREEGRDRVSEEERERGRKTEGQRWREQGHDGMRRKRAGGDVGGEARGNRRDRRNSNGRTFRTADTCGNNNIGRFDAARKSGFQRERAIVDHHDRLQNMQRSMEFNFSHRGNCSASLIAPSFTPVLCHTSFSSQSCPSHPPPPPQLLRTHAQIPFTQPRQFG